MVITMKNIIIVKIIHENILKCVLKLKYNIKVFKFMIFMGDVGVFGE